MHSLVESQREGIKNICRRFGIRKLELFGSAARVYDFDTARSDIDLLVEFDSAHEAPSLSTFFDAQTKLGELLGRPVNLAMAGAIRNPFVRADIDRSRETVYAT